MGSRSMGRAFGIGGSALLLSSVAAIAVTAMHPLPPGLVPRIWDAAGAATVSAVVASLIAAKAHSRWWLCLTVAACLWLGLMLASLG